MRIGEVADKAGVSVRAPRYYEEKGLLPAYRSPGGQRHRPDTAVERITDLPAVRDRLDGVTAISEAIASEGGGERPRACARLRAVRVAVGDHPGVRPVAPLKVANERVDDQMRSREDGSAPSREDTPPCAVVAHS
ncbi:MULTISPECIES: MerR family DNA-binding transcriptional regulator [Streptomyces]|uniref:MerR family DNA-binding transcriptional regulator n=1 Tax=Streptomyces TaxID=1883 RepID=UPI001ADD4740|nr:MerR family DNA-binding transcriptional regulator [Streptomyces sp. 4R-3d]